MLSINHLFKNKNQLKDEITEYFYERTKNHINRVRKYIDLIYNSNQKKYQELLIRKETHDESKYKEPELTPYIYLTWRYKLKDEGKEIKFPKKLEDSIHNATLHHIKHNRHHPEFHDSNTDNKSLNKKDRDEVPEKMVDGTNMNQIDIAEMVADWMAMAEEKGTNPLNWANKNINKRWKFTEEQVNHIYELLNIYVDK